MQATTIFSSFDQILQNLPPPLNDARTLLAASVSTVAGAIFLLIQATSAVPVLWSVVPGAFFVIAATDLAYRIYLHVTKAENAAENNKSEELDSTSKLVKSSAVKSLTKKPSKSSNAKLETMIDNTAKAHEYYLNISRKAEKDSYPPIEKVLPTVEMLTHPQGERLTLRAYAHADQGPRDSMEDTHVIATGSGTLLAVFDGHGGNQVARFAANIFADIFERKLKENGYEPFDTFNETFKKIHKKVCKIKEWECTGCTASVAYIDKFNRLFGSVLGDAEVLVYRKNSENAWKAIPVARIQDWRTDADRAAEALGDPTIADLWKDLPYKPHFPHKNMGVNTSGAIGDEKFCRYPFWRDEGDPGLPGVIQTPITGVIQLEEGDIIIAACDGIDYVKRSEILNKIKETESDFRRLPEELVNFAIDKKKAFDNVTVIAAKASLPGKKEAKISKA